MSQGEVIDNSSVNVKPDKPLEYNTGAVEVKKGSGMSKVRKGQTEEEYLVQKEMFWKTGPVISTDTCLIDKLTEFIENGFRFDNMLKNDSSNNSNEEDVVVSLDNLKIENKSVMTCLEKIDRELLLKGLEKLYFNKDYERCLLYSSSILEDMSKIDLSSKSGKAYKRNVQDVTEIRDLCLDKLKTAE